MPPCRRLARARAITFSSRGFVFVMPIVSEESLDTPVWLRIVSRGKIRYSRRGHRLRVLHRGSRDCQFRRGAALSAVSSFLRRCAARLNLIARTVRDLEWQAGEPARRVA